MDRRKVGLEKGPGQHRAGGQNESRPREVGLAGQGKRIDGWSWEGG